MDSLIPDEFVGRRVASADMMYATTGGICPDESVIRGRVTLTADELRRKYARQVDEYSEFLGMHWVMVDEEEPPVTEEPKKKQSKSEAIDLGGIPASREQKIAEAKKSPINRLLRWFKKWCGSPVVEI